MKKIKGGKMAKRKSNPTKIYDTRPGSGWVAADPAINAKQARRLVKSWDGVADAKIVRTGKRGDIFPYTIYINRKNARKRR